MAGRVLSALAVNGQDGTATLTLNGAEICAITRPLPQVFRQQLALVRAYADLRGDRIPEIIIQDADILSFFGALAHLNPSRRKHTLELLELVQSIAVVVEMQVKHLCRAARPVDWSDRVQPVIQTPDHSAFPSGHATEAFALATVLHQLRAGQGPEQATAQRPLPLEYTLAHRIAANRVVAGLHFPVDSAAGALLGCAIGAAIVALSTGGCALRTGYGGLTDPALGGDEDFSMTWLGAHLRAGSVPAAADAVLADVWAGAAAEWRAMA
jgi:membrane-associated phospholipid phosphatase